MKVIFKNVKLHHFLSFGDAEIALDNLGYVLITGRNNNPDDSAISNGSGKSSIWSAICWALTGETINGLSKNIDNIHFNDGCWVELDFSIDNNEYKIIRSKNDKIKKTDLKIFINGEDKSGKGIRESEELLLQYLPDLTSDLIGSVIILGQGMPHKFSNNTPAKRKELLEKLSKSEFMIEDIKNRLSKRDNELNVSLRDYSDTLLQSSTQLEIYLNNNNNLEKELTSLPSLETYDKEIGSCSNKLALLKEELENLSSALIHNEEVYTELKEERQKIVTEYDQKKKDLFEEYTNVYSKLLQNLSSIKAESLSLENQINKYKSIVDICPTCGQKIPGIIKVDTSSMEEELSTKHTVVSSLSDEIDDYKKLNKKQEETIDILYNEKLVIIDSKISKLMNENKNIIKNKDDVVKIINSYTNKLTELTLSKNNLQDRKLSLEANISNLQNKITSLQNSIAEIIIKKQNIIDRLDIVNKMISLVKRDFRGLLLSNIISFINTKAKEYCKLVFNTELINFSLEGNNIDISYNGKDFDNLSGGEKQKVDLILQFSIRDMMSQYLGFSSNILVLDEIFDNLDSKGCYNVLNLISSKLSDVESIFIISHHGHELSIPADSEIIVEKNSKGISEVK